MFHLTVGGESVEVGVEVFFVETFTALVVDGVVEILAGGVLIHCFLVAAANSRTMH